MKFSPFHDNVLCAATSTGSLSLWTPTYSPSRSGDLPDFSSSVPLGAEQTCHLQYFQPDVLVLSSTWHPHHPEVIGVTLSSGDIYLVKVPREALIASPVVNLTSDLLQKILIFSGTLEVWTLAFNPLHDEICSGSDDSALRLHNLPHVSHMFAGDVTGVETTGFGVLSMRQDQRIHGAGVTAILYLLDNIIMTGSYDCVVRIIFIPSKGRLQVLAEANLDGGVWRLKLERSSYDVDGNSHPDEYSYDILASCMHAGVRIVRVEKKTGGDWTIHLIAKFEEHKSMNYGSDSCFNKKPGARTVISTSFYDALVCLWEYAS